MVNQFDGAFYRSVPSTGDFKKVDSLPVDDTWRSLLLSGAAAHTQLGTRGREPRVSPCPLSLGVAAHMPLEPSLNPKGDIAYTNYVADQMEKGALAVCGVTKDFTYGANVPCTSVLVDVAGAT